MNLLNVPRHQRPKNALNNNQIHSNSSSPGIVLKRLQLECHHTRPSRAVEESTDCFQTPFGSLRNLHCKQSFCTNTSVLSRGSRVIHPFGNSTCPFGQRQGISERAVADKPFEWASPGLSSVVSPPGRPGRFTNNPTRFMFYLAVPAMF